MSNVNNFKKFRGGIRLETQSSDPTGNLEEGAIVYNSTEKSLKVHNGSGFAAVGGGAGGSLDTFYTEDFTTTPKTDFTATTVSINDLSIETSSAIDSKSLKFQQSGTTAGTILHTAGIVPTLKQKGNTCSIAFWYTYDGNDDDIKILVKSTDGSDVVTTISAGTDLLKTATTTKKFTTTFTIPSDSAKIQWGFEIVTGVSNKILLIDDVEMSQDPFVQIDLLNNVASLPTLSDEVACISKKDGNYTIGTSSETTINATTKTIIPWTAPHKDTHSKFDTTNSVYVIPEDGIYHIDMSVTYRSNASDDDSLLIMELNNVNYSNFASRGKYTTSYYDSSSTYQTAKLTFTEEYAKDDELRFYWFGSDTNYLQGHDEKSFFSIYKAPQKIAAAPIPVTTNSHIITPAKSNLTDWQSYSLTDASDLKLNSLTGIDTNGTQGQWRRVGDSMEVKFTIKWSGNGDSGTLKIELPESYQIDSSKLPDTNDIGGTAGTGFLGHAYWYDSAASDMHADLTIVRSGSSPSNAVQLAGDYPDGVSTGLFSSGLSTNDRVSGTFTVPIVGWGAQDSNFLAALPMTKWQQKTLTSSHTADNSDISSLSFTNLDSTKTYKLSVTLKMVVRSNGLGVGVRDAANGTGNLLHTFYGYDPGDDEHELGAGIMMLSGITSIYFHAFDLDAGAGEEIIGGTGTTDQTKVILEELPMHTEVDIW